MRAIEFKNVSFRYEDMPEPVLKNASFSLEYGKLALLYGDSGQGKSTVLSILSGVIPNVTKGTLSGEVRVGGEDVSGQRISDICRRAGVVLQNADAQIIHQRVEDELAFGCENFAFSPEKISGCIEKACARMALCPQWGTRTLSGGQKQRLITASALATEQRILLLDEPLANLDRKGAAFLMASLRTLTESGYAVLIVEHRLEQVLPFAHEVWRLRNGSLERQTGREALCTTQPEAAALIPAEARREEPVMTLRGVGWRAGGRSILEGVDLTIFRGERLLLLGDNGCGKTSLLRLMARLARPTAGEIRQLIDPALGQRRGSRAWFRRVGVVYQNLNCQLFMPTVSREVAFAAKSEDFAREIMELFGIVHLSERHPHSLSEGQKRRVSIAAVAASQPELLLLDEPTVGQDGEGLRTLLQALNLLHTRTGSTIVTVTHDRRCAGALCDRVAWLREGRIEKTGGPELIEAAWGDLAALRGLARGTRRQRNKKEIRATAMKERKNFWDRNAGRYDRFMRKDWAAYEEMYALIRPVVKAKTVLELATGTGLIAKQIVNAAAHIEATDASAEMILEAKRDNRSAKLHFSVQDMFRLPYAGKSFDVVIVSNALHIVPQPEKALAEIRRVLKDDGVLIAPTFTHAGNSFTGKVRAFFMKLAGFPLHSKWTSEEYLKFLEQNGWTVRKSVVLKASFPLTYAECVKSEV